MRITFTIEVNNFLAAAEIEEVLKNKNVKYTTAIHNSKAARTHTKRKEVTLDQARGVVYQYKLHPKWTMKQLGDTQRLGEEVTRRILTGKHPICEKMK